MGEWALLAAFAVLAAIVFVVARRRRVVTIRRYRSIARRLGLEYRPTPVGIEDLGFLQLLIGEMLSINHELSDPSRRGAPRLFELRSSFPPFRSVLFRLQLTCVVVRLDFTAPHTVITARGRRTSIGRHLAGPAIASDLDGFNDRWRVTCDDLEFAERLLDDRLTRWLMTISPSGVHHFELFGDHALLAAELMVESRAPALLDLAVDFLDHLPSITDR